MPLEMNDDSSSSWHDFLELNFIPTSVILDHNNRIIICGGGGSANFGIPNQLIIIKAQGNKIKRLYEYETGDKVPLNICCHPTENIIACSQAEFCYLYSISRSSFHLLTVVKTDESTIEDKCQIKVGFTSSGEFLVSCATDGSVRIWKNLPNLQLESKVYPFGSVEILDLSVSEKYFVAMTRENCGVYSLETGDIVKTIPLTNNKYRFKNVKFSPGKTKSQEIYYNNTSAGNTASYGCSKWNLDFIFKKICSYIKKLNRYNESSFDNLVLLNNTATSGATTEKQNEKNPESMHLYIVEFMQKPARQCIVKIWDTINWKCIKKKNIRYSSENISCFSISMDGNFLGIGSTEGEIRVLDALNLTEIQRARVHDYFVSDLVFVQNPRPTHNINNEKTNEILILSASGDRTVRSTPLEFKNNYYFWKKNIFILILLFVIVLGLFYKIFNEESFLDGLKAIIPIQKDVKDQVFEIIKNIQF